MVIYELQMFVMWHILMVSASIVEGLIAFLIVMIPETLYLGATATTGVVRRPLVNAHMLSSTAGFVEQFHAPYRIFENVGHSVNSHYSSAFRIVS